jgi:hypothetical protein
MCSGYPMYYFNSITALGLPRLSGFDLAPDKEEAFKRLGAKPS